MKLLSTFFFCFFSFLHMQGQYTITNYAEADGLVNKVVNCVTVDKDDNVWFGTNRGISKFDGTNWTSITLADDVNFLDEIVTAIYARENGDIWIGTDFGAGVWDGMTFTNYVEVSELGNVRVQAITEGNNGEMFFGTKGGWARLMSDGTWSTFGSAEGLPFGGVKDLEITSDGVVWAGLGLEGLARYDYGTEELDIFQEGGVILNNAVTGITLYENQMWVTSGGGVDELYYDNGIFDFMPHPSVFTLPPPHELNQAVDVQVDSKETVWVGIFIDYLVNVGGVSYYEDGVWTSITTAEGLVGPGVNELAIDSKDCVWVATSTGVSKICAGPSTVSNFDLARIDAYPNPVSDFIHVRLGEAASASVPVILYNMQGQRMHQDHIKQGQTSISMAAQDLAAGSYILRVGEFSQVVTK